jgi:predicted nuclease with TOPRIM domain
MADAGGIVGTVSLTLQVLQGLKWYYSHFTSYGDDLAAIITRIEHIENNLEILDNTVQRLKHENDAIAAAAAVQTNIISCADVVRKLEECQKKCGEPQNNPATLKRRVILIKKRALYPFRKETLESLQKQLGRLLENLLVIMQALQL